MVASCTVKTGRMSASAAVVIAFGMISFPGRTAEQDPTTCLQTATVTIQLTECGRAIELAAEKRMADAYQEVECRVSDASEKRQLADSQKAWEGYRNSYCEFKADGGSISGLGFGLCAAGLAADRTKELNNWLADVGKRREQTCQPGK